MIKGQYWLGHSAHYKILHSAIYNFPPWLQYLRIYLIVMLPAKLLAFQILKKRHSCHKLLTSASVCKNRMKAYAWYYSCGLKWNHMVNPLATHVLRCTYVCYTSMLATWQTSTKTTTLWEILYFRTSNIPYDATSFAQ